MTRANIILLLKRAKPPTNPNSYSPILLLQSDIKSLMKVPVLRLNKVITSLVHYDQVEFMPQKLTFISWVKLLYNAPKAAIREGGRLPPTFRLRRGTWQGCLL